MTDLFDDKPSADQQKQPETPAVQTPDYSDLLAGIKNERGEQKFKSVEDLVNGYTASQEFIGTLKGEKSTIESRLQELTGKVKSQEELQELLKQAPAEEVPEVVPTEIPAGISAEDVVKILAQEEQKKVANSNVTSVKEAVKAVNGDLKELTEKVGLTPDLAQKMAEDILVTRLVTTLLESRRLTFDIDIHYSFP